MTNDQTLQAPLPTVITIAGEVMLETRTRLPATGIDLIEDGVFLRLGGPAWNMALSLSALGAPVALTGPIGEACRHDAEALAPNVDLSRAAWLPGSSDLLTLIHDTGIDGYRALYQRAPIDNRQLDAIGMQLTRASMLVLTGSRHERIRDLYCDFVEAFKPTRLVFAPNYATRTFNAAQLRLLIESADLISLNEVEVQLALGMLDLDTEAKLASMSNGTLIVTRAARGATVYPTARASKFDVAPLSGSPSEHFGAGDAFLSGFIVARERGDAVDVAARYAAGAAACFINQPGEWPTIDDAAIQGKLRRGKTNSKTRQKGQ